MSSPWSSKPTLVASKVVLRPFTASDVHRVELEVYANNPRALAVHQRVGFVVEGVQREVFVFDGQRTDAVVMSVLRPEWAARRPA